MDATAEIDGVFDRILRDLIERIPSARGAVFVDAEGETLGQFAFTMANLDLSILGAQWSTVWTALAPALERAGQAAADEILVQCQASLTIIRRVAEGFHLVIELRRESHLAAARDALDESVAALRREMG